MLGARRSSITGTCTFTAGRTWRAVVWLVALLLLPVPGSESVRAEEVDESVLPELPAKIRAQLEANQLRREIELEQLRRELEDLKGSDDADVARKIERLGELRRLLEVDRDVRELLESSPEMAEEYERIVQATAPGQPETPRGSCACLESARVHWLGQGDQAGQVTVFLDGAYYDVGAGETIGNSRCSVGQTLSGSVVLQCGAQRAIRGLYSPVERTPQTSQ
ncbi:MAG: hypothetical protein OXH52_11675 [Gammaproteobacteria bacterium]|nr:hypothetical protein [Gammaproteobacteria bacterium]